MLKWWSRRVNSLGPVRIGGIPLFLNPLLGMPGELEPEMHVFVRFVKVKEGPRLLPSIPKGNKP